MSKSTRKGHAVTESAVAAEGVNDHPVIVAGIGVGTGGTKSLKKLLGKIPSGMGIAYVLVLHPGPSKKILTIKQLKNLTALEVVEATEGMPVLADRIHVMPSDRFLNLTDGRLTLHKPVQCDGMWMPIDHFLCTLAHDCRRRSCGIVLSGAGSDGTLGLSEIKAFGGSTFVEKPGSAGIPEMPQSAIDAGVADKVLAAGMMAEAIASMANQLIEEIRRTPANSQDTNTDLKSILEILRAKIGYDFSGYKPNTLVRRIRRRMTLSKLASYVDYAGFLNEHPDEVALLQKDLLIGVTEFFRQPQAWETLEEKVVATLVENAQPGSIIRVWVPGCSTGQEAYSLAMVLNEQVKNSGKQVGIQIFATDSDFSALATARSGSYSKDEIGEAVSAGRLKRFFERKEGRFQILKQIRGQIVFAPQNLTADPPFSRLDLISCRNLLMYLEQPVQQKIIVLFHFALRPGGFLFLGTAETTGEREDLFDPVSKKWRIYRRIGIGHRASIEIPVRTSGQVQPLAGAIPVTASAPRLTLASAAQQMLLYRFAPACVMIDRKLHVLYVHGKVEDYLTFPTGELTTRIVDMAREGLRARLRGAIGKCMEMKRPVSVIARVRRGEKSVPVKATVSPLRHPRETDGLLLVTFEDHHLTAAKSGRKSARESDVQQLADELKVTREELQSTIEQLESSNDQLKASNEEVTAANEELQSGNEELETSKEELQSLNEELNTINARLQDKVGELENTNNDVLNLLSSTTIATVFLDKELRVNRFTPASTRLLSLIPSDLGRPVVDVLRRFTDETLLDDARRVLTELSPLAKEVQAEDGRWYIRRITPYRTQDDRIEGVVLTFVDISDIKQAEEALRRAHARMEWLARLPEEDPSPVLRVSIDGEVLYGNPAAMELDGWKCEIGRPVPEMILPLIKQAMTEGREVMQDAELGERTFSIAVTSFASEGYVNVYGRDITKRKQSEEAILQAKEEWERTFDTVPDLIAILDDRHRIVRVNKAMADRLGVTPKNCIGLLCHEAVHGLSEPAAFCPHSLTCDDGQQHVAEVHEPRLGGDFLVSTTPLCDPARRLVGSVHVARDITDRKRTEIETERLASFPKLNPGPIVEADLEGLIKYSNPAAEALFPDLVELGARHPWLADWESVTRSFREGRTKVNTRDVSVSGSWYQLSMYFVEEAGRVRIYGLDITERRRAQQEHEITAEFLRLVNESAGMQDLVRKAIAFFQKQSGCEAVGIRLREGDDYPYYEARGFPEEFLLLENSLCQRNPDGSVVRDLSGNPAIECMCGNIIEGRFDPSKPFFTEYGSFWANSTTRLLASTTETDRQARTRNRCNGEGYESVALIPLRIGEERLGLLQMNDRREGVFISEIIRQWERLAGHLAVALAKMRTEEALKKSEESYRSLFNGMNEGFALHEIILDETGIPCDYRFLDINPAFEQLTGLKRGDVVGKTMYEVLPGNDPYWVKIYGEVALSGESIHFENHSTPLNKDFEVFAYRPAAQQFAALFVDITDRKKQEDELRKFNRTLRALSNSSHALMRAEEERAYLEEVCRIVVQDCGYAMVWIGYAEHDEAKTIRPVVHAGFEDGYLETLNLTWADTERGRGPGGTAIRTGKPGMCTNMLTDPRFAPWRDQAIKRGYASSVVFPLLTGETAFGEITIYSKHPDPFSQDELNLLSELAEDLTHGITTLRLRQQNRQAQQALLESEEALRQANENLEQRVRERTMDLQNLTAQLERGRDELRKLASELVMAEERERKRIAGVLHDEIAQTLAAVRMRLDLLQGSQSDQKDTALQDAKALLVQSIQETRALMNDLGNPLLFDMGLKPACEALANRLMERHPVRINCDIRDTFNHLNPDVKAILYQLIRELLNNVVKHSRAQNAHVTINMDNERLRVTITDDGVGFDPQQLGPPTIDGGFGIYSLRERLIAVDGSLRIESAPGTGTVITAILPVEL